MTNVPSHELPAFLRRFRFPGGRIRGVRLLNGSQKRIAVEFRLTVREALKDLGTDPKNVRLVLRLGGVEEYRFQMRPNMPKSKIADARFSHLNGLFYVNFDAWSLEPNEQPKVFDFRASEVFAAGRELSWEVIEK
jgi:hypothetical protein